MLFSTLSTDNSTTTIPKALYTELVHSLGNAEAEIARLKVNIKKKSKEIYKLKAQVRRNEIKHSKIDEQMRQALGQADIDEDNVSKNK